MVETAVAGFGLSLSAALDLTLFQYRLHHRAHRRRIRDEHERDLRIAWMTASMVNRPISYRALERLIAGRGAAEDIEAQRRREFVMAEFEDAYLAELAAERIAAPVRHVG